MMIRFKAQGNLISCADNIQIVYIYMSYLLKVRHSGLFYCISMTLIVLVRTSGNYWAAPRSATVKYGPFESTELSQLILAMALHPSC